MENGWKNCQDSYSITKQASYSSKKSNVVAMKRNLDFSHKHLPAAPGALERAGLHSGSRDYADVRQRPRATRNDMEMLKKSKSPKQNRASLGALRPGKLDPLT